MARTRNTDHGTDADYGTHVTMLRARARRPDPKNRKGRDNTRRAAVHRSQQES